MALIDKLFNEENSTLYPYILKIIQEYKSRDYKFYNQDKFLEILKKDQNEGLKIYWEEILFRIHYSSILSLIRNSKWVESIILNYKSNNFIGFCSSLRGLLESSADCYDSFILIPIRLAPYLKDVDNILNLKYSEGFLTSQELEDTLIHFTHGRRLEKNSQSPNSHKARTMKYYISKIDEEENGPLYELYSLLCQITHPAAHSLFSYIEMNQNDSYEVLKIDKNTDSKNIKSMVKTNSQKMSDIFVAAFYTALLNLKLLNYLSDKSFYTQEIDEINFNDSAMWKEVSKKIKLR